MLKITRYPGQRTIVYPSETPTIITVLGDKMARLGFEGDADVMREEIAGDFDIAMTGRQDAIIRLLAIIGKKELDELERREVDYVRERFLTGLSC